MQMYADDNGKEEEAKMDVNNNMGRCERLYEALCDCHRRMPAGPPRESGCRHLNRSLAECMVSALCPSEVEAVRSLCSSSGTSLKRSQCRKAQGKTDDWRKTSAKKGVIKNIFNTVKTVT